MLVEAHRGLEPPPVRIVTKIKVSERVYMSFCRLSYQALLGRKNPLSS